MENLVANGGFEGSYRNWNGLPEIQLANDWLPFWVAHQANDPDWKNRTPVFRPVTRLTDARRVRSGNSAQMYFTGWATHIAGIMQQVTVLTGTRVQLKAFGHSWSTNDDASEWSKDPGNVRMKVGIDPTGELNPFRAHVVWSAEKSVYDTFDTGFQVETQAGADVVTIFLLSAPEWPRKHNQVFWDDVSLIATPEAAQLEGPGLGPVLVIDSPTRLVRYPVSVYVSDTKELTNLALQIIGPDGSLNAVSRGSSVRGNETVWRWEFVPATEGEYSVTVTSDSAPKKTASITISGAKPSVGTLSNDRSSALTPQRGKPRTQYERVYVLMPPNTDSQWLSALLQSGVLQDRHWTLGFSADDAGIGDLDRRTVVVVNPTAWEDPIEPWFELWYPGVIVRSVFANTPAQLGAKLGALRL